MKNVLAFLAASLVAVFLVACGNEAPKQGEVKAPVAVPAQAPAKEHSEPAEVKPTAEEPASAPAPAAQE